MRRLLFGLLLAFSSVALADGVRAGKSLGDTPDEIFKPAVASGTDPYWANVVLLAANDNAADGTTTFVDQSTSAKSITGGNSIAYSSTTAPTGMSTCVKFVRASVQYLSLASSADFGFGTGDFTDEFWLYLSSASVNHQTSDYRVSEPSVKVDLYIDISSQPVMYVNGAIKIQGNALSQTTWYAVALSRVSGTTKAFVNGTQVGSSYADANDYGAAATLVIGVFAPNLTGNPLDGYICSKRVTKGVGRYTGTYTPPSLPLPTN